MTEEGPEALRSFVVPGDDTRFRRRFTIPAVKRLGALRVTSMRQRLSEPIQASQAHFTTSGVRSIVLPILLTGRVASGGRAPAVAFAVNGTIAAVSEVYRDGRVSAMAMDSLLRPGANELEAFLVRGTPSRPVLERAEVSG